MLMPTKIESETLRRFKISSFQSNSKI